MDREDVVAATVEVLYGDMFDGPSDVVVIPCSTVPSVTWFVADRLRLFDIPQPPRPMKLGEVHYEPLTSASQLAVVAASPHRLGSPAQPMRTAPARSVGRLANTALPTTGQSSSRAL